jgi:hypothetical protein
VTYSAPSPPIVTEPTAPPRGTRGPGTTCTQPVVGSIVTTDPLPRHEVDTPYSNPSAGSKSKSSTPTASDVSRSGTRLTTLR